MANFCTQCGKSIAECTCGQNKNPQVNGGQYYPPNVVYPTPPYPNPNPTPNPKTNTTSGGSAITIDTEKLKSKLNDKKISFWEYMGLNEAEQTDNSNPYERGLKIVPDIVKPCDGEIPIKQYNVGKFRSFFSFKWAEARIQVTNKRVIFRCSGKSPFGKDFTQSEHSIDELVGLNFSKGVRLSFLTLLIMLLINIPIMALCSLMTVGIYEGLDSVVVPSLIGLAGFAGLIAAMVFLKKKYFYNSMIAAAALALNVGVTAHGNTAFLLMRGGTDAFFVGLSLVLGAVCEIIYLYYWIKVSLKPSASIAFTTKNSSKNIMGMFSPRIAKANISAEILPAQDTDIAFNEINAIINDVQNMGDGAIEKWKEN